MIRLSNIDESIKDKHKEWFDSYVKKKLEKKIKELEAKKILQIPIL